MKKCFVLVLVVLLTAFAGNTHAMEVDLLGGVNIHGFISQGYLRSQDNNYLANDSSDGTFAFNEIGINFSKQLTDQLRIGLQIFSHDLGAIGNNDIVLDWAFADYRWRDWLGLRVGKIKVPHGLYNEIRDMDMLRTNILLPQGVYNEILRDTMVAFKGMGLYGNIPAGSAGSFSYYLLAGVGDVKGDDNVGAVRYFNSLPTFEVAGDFEFKTSYMTSLEWRPPLEGLLLKHTYMSAKVEIPAKAGGAAAIYESDRQVMFVYSIEYTWNDLVLAAELMKGRGDYSVDIPAFGGIVQEGLRKERGYYVSAAYRFNDWFEAGTYYSVYYPDSTDKDGDDGVASGMYRYDYEGWLKDYALSLRFDINEFWTAKIEGHLMDGAALCLAVDNNELEEDWYMIAAKLSFSF